MSCLWRWCIVVKWLDGSKCHWYGGRPRPMRQCVRWGPSSSPQKGAQQPSLFGPCMSVVAKRCPSQQLLSSWLWQTHCPRYSVRNNMPHLHITAMPPKSIFKKYLEDHYLVSYIVRILVKSISHSADFGSFLAIIARVVVGFCLAGCRAAYQPIWWGRRRFWDELDYW